VDVENKYYNAKQMKADNPEEAIEEFLGVPGLEEQKGDWGFKGLKQAIKLEFKLGRYDKVGLITSQVRNLVRTDCFVRPLNTTPSSLRMSNPPSRAITRKSPSTTCSTSLRRTQRMRQQTSAWSTSTQRRWSHFRPRTTSGYGCRRTRSWLVCGWRRRTTLA